MRSLIALFSLLLLLVGLILLPLRAEAQVIDVFTPTPTLFPTSAPAPPAQPVIASPAGGDALQGQVTITGASGVPGFFSYELSFAYTGDTTNTWFLIEESFNPVLDDTLAVWDTFAITDGTYDLRLLVILVDNSRVETIVRGVRVRNYSLIETNTPVPGTPTPTIDLTLAFVPSETPTATLTPTSTLIPPTVTPLPRNPAEIVPQQISDTLLRGAAGTLAAFLLLGMYVSVRRRRRP